MTSTRVPRLARSQAAPVRLATALASVAVLTLAVAAPSQALTRTPSTSAQTDLPMSVRTNFDPAPATQLRATGLTDILSVSDNGQIALGKVGKKYVVRDVLNNKTLLTLKSSKKLSYNGLTGDGKKLLFSKILKVGPCGAKWNQPWMRDVKTKKDKLIAADKRGKALKTDWASKAACEDETPSPDIAEVLPNAVSPTGQFVAFCSSLASHKGEPKPPDNYSGPDLYIKDTKTGALTRRPFACSEWSAQETPSNGPLAPQMSADGQVVLIGGSYDGESAEQVTDSDDTRLFLGGTELRSGLGLLHPELRRDGKIVDGARFLDWAPVTYDVQTGASTTLPAGVPSEGWMSNDGRYVLAFDSVLFDRVSGTRSDAFAGLAGAGYTPKPDTDTVMSSDASTMFIQMDTCNGAATPCGVYALPLIK